MDPTFLKKFYKVAVTNCRWREGKTS